MVPLAKPHARRTVRLGEALLKIACALGGEGGERQSKAHGMPVCAATLLSLLRQAPEGDLPTPRVLGVDDWWFGTAHRTGTILVESRAPSRSRMCCWAAMMRCWLSGCLPILGLRSSAGIEEPVILAARRRELLMRDRCSTGGISHKNVGEVLKLTVAQHVDVGGSSRPAGEDDLPTARRSPALRGKTRRQATQTTSTQTSDAWPPARLATQHVTAASMNWLWHPLFSLRDQENAAPSETNGETNTYRWSTLLIIGIVLWAPQWNRIGRTSRRDGPRDLS